MPILDIFSKRTKARRGDAPDVYRYDILPPELRVQILYIFRDGLFRGPHLDQIVDGLCREFGWVRLADVPRERLERYGQRNHVKEVVQFVETEEDVEKVLSLVELALQFMARRGHNQLVDEMNHRFREHGIGYHFEAGQLLRIDDEMIHREAVLPTLRVLAAPEFAGAQQEFLAAHAAYREGRNKDAISECLRALESTLKVIAQKRKWPLPRKPNAKPLLDLAFEKGLVPEMWLAYFNGLRPLLECGVPTGRNALAGHGQGSEAVDVPEHIVAFVLHQTATSVLFLVQSEEHSR